MVYKKHELLDFKFTWKKKDNSEHPDTILTMYLHGDEIGHIELNPYNMKWMDKLNNELPEFKNQNIQVIWIVYVKRAFRGKGYSHLLLNELVSNFKEYFPNINLLTLTVESSGDFSNYQLIQLYKQYGFVQSKTNSILMYRIYD